jgi:hypothetical protein
MPNDPITSSANGAVTPGDKSALVQPKRAVRRCQFVASAEVTELGSQTQLSARTSEIGLGGCYVDTLSPFPDGTIVRVRIIRDGGVFESQGKVVYVQDRFGMGIAFTEIAPDQRALLQNWIAELVMQLK